MNVSARFISRFSLYVQGCVKHFGRKILLVKRFTVVEIDKIVSIFVCIATLMVVVKKLNTFLTDNAGVHQRLVDSVQRKEDPGVRQFLAGFHFGRSRYD